MARESLGWRERGQANFCVREGEKGAGLRAVARTKRDGGVQETRRRDSEGPLGSGSGVRYTTDGVSKSNGQKGPRAHAIDGKKEKGRYIDKSRATA